MTESLARLDGTFDPAGDPGWEPLLPLPFAPDVVEACRVLSRGSVGDVRQLHLLSYFGIAERMEWDPPVLPAGPREAAVWGLDLAEALLGGLAAETSWIQPLSEAGGLAQHVVAGIPVIHSLLPTLSGPLTSFEARIIAAEGTILLRPPFAPGSPVVVTGRSFMVPVVPEAKTPLDEPDSYSGGLGLRRLRLHIGADEQGRRQRQARATRLLAHVQASAGDAS